MPSRVPHRDASTSGAPGAVAGLVFLLARPAPGSAAAIARTSAAVRPAFDRCSRAETRLAVPSAQSQSTDLGLAAMRDSAPWLAMCSGLAFVSSPTDDGPAAEFVSRAARSRASRSRESHPPSSAGPTSAGHPADHASVAGSRLPESSLDDPPGTGSPTLPVVPKTTAWLRWLRWLRCPPPPDFPRQRKTLAPHCLH